MKNLGIAISSWISLILVLLMITLFGFLSIKTKSLVNLLQERVLAVAFIDKSASSRDISSLIQMVEEISAVKSVKYISSDEAIKSYRNEIEGELAELYEMIQIPPSLEIQFKPEIPSNELSAELKILAKNKRIEEVNFENELHNQIEIFSGNAQKSILWVAFFLLLISIFLIHNTVKLTIYAKRHLIKSMQLVGASKWFILKPFLRNSLLRALAASVIAFAIASPLSNYLFERILDYLEIQGGSSIYDFSVNSFFSVNSILFAIVLGIGVVVTVGTSWYATNKYLNSKLDDLY